jgi:hypothetical protein
LVDADISEEPASFYARDGGSSFFLIYMTTSQNTVILIFWCLKMQKRSHLSSNTIIDGEQMRIGKPAFFLFELFWNYPGRPKENL